MSNTRAIARNTMYQMAGKLVTLSVAILVTALITRKFGVEGFGVYSLISGFPALFYIIADLGLNAISTRDLSVSDKEINKNLGNVLILRLIFSSVLIVVAAAAVLLLPYPSEIKIGIIVALFTILSVSLFATSNIGFQVRLRYDLSNIANSLGSILIPVSVVAIILLDLKIIYTSIALVFASFSSVLLAFIFLKKLGISPTMRFDWQYAKNLLIQSTPLGLMLMFSQINFKADSILLSFLRLPEEYGLSNIETVGIYSLPYKVFEVSLVVPTFFMNSVYPVMVRNYSQGKQKLIKTFKKAITVLLIAGIFTALAGLLFSDFAISLLAGEGFEISAEVLKIFLLFSLIFYITQPLAWLIVTLRGQKYLPWIYLCAALLNIGLNMLYIPKYSIFASANITWITELLILVLLLITARKLLKGA